ncbi:VacJ family lipoprotein [Candidatus Pelagibacter sp.]|nr:VacJ family lipoprotein [Candidatus Pelagibacter sp.]|tara:strand:+ start:481 stop:1272 length:792 start_codon:yes stop_codon:yes gene_type:complete
MRKLLSLIIITTFTLVVNVNASSDGELLLKKNEPSEVKDCFETVNRATFALNQVLDGIIFKPVASVYKKLPSPLKSGVSNSLDNLSNLVTIPNNLLQGDFELAGINTGRFLVNTTFGILGLVDVAQYLGMTEYEKEDYGQSLAKAGVGPGCYVVLPILGPSTARDTVASVTNFLGGDAWYNVTVRNDTQYFRDIDYYSSKITGGVDFRAKNFDAIENLEKNSLDFYASVKSLYLQDRQQKILNVKKIIETQNDSDWEEIEDQQ